MNPIIGDNSGYNRRNSYSNRYSNGSQRPTSFRSGYRNYVPNDMSEEEQLRRAYEESLRDNQTPGQPSAQPTAPPYPTEPQNPSDAETLRRLRLRRYQNF